MKNIYRSIGLMTIVEKPPIKFQILCYDLGYIESLRPGWATQ
jgi:hypothetical protein